MKFPHGFTATVIRPGGHDRHGNPLPSSEHEISRCARDQQRSSEVVDGTLVVTTTERILCDDPDADVRAGDFLRLPGETGAWQVSGDVDRPASPFTGWRPGCVIPVERATSSSVPQE